MKPNLIILILLIPFFFLKAEGQHIFQKTHTIYNGNGIEQTFDGGYVTCGNGLAKTDNVGNAQWAKRYSWGIYDVQQTPDSGFILSGGIITGSGGWDFYLVKTNKSGDTLWTRAYGGTEGEWDASVQQAADGGYLVAGFTASFGTSFSNIYVVKTDSTGDTLWTRIIGNGGWDQSNDIIMCTDGNYMIVGNTQKQGIDYDIFMIKITDDGDTLWTKTYGGWGSEYVKSVIQTSDNGYLIIGSTISFAIAGQADIYIIKTDSVGALLWSKTYGGAYVDEPAAARQLPDGGYLITGRTQSFGAGGNCNNMGPCYDVYLIRTDSLGDTLWTKTYGGTDLEWASDMELTSDGGCMIIARTSSFAPPNDTYTYWIKADGNGASGCNQYNTGTIVGTPQTVVENGIFNIASGGIITNTSSPVITVVDESNILCDSCILPVVSFTYTDSILIVEFNGTSGNTSGSWYWDFGDGNTDTVQNPTHTYTSSGTYYVCLYASNVCGTNSICDSITVTVVGINQSLSTNNLITIYPNPATSELHINDNGVRLHRMEIYDSFGRLLRSQYYQAWLDVSALPNGIYFLRLTDEVDGTVISKSFIKQ